MTKLTELQESILREALASEDGIYVGIFEGELTREERDIEKELPLMADDNLLLQISPGTFRITSHGRMMLHQRQNVSGRILALSAAILLLLGGIILGAITGLAGEWASFLFGPGREF